MRPRGLQSGVCISEHGEPTDAIAGKPFFFRAPPRAIEALAALGVGAVSLANNHALDFGEVALEETLSLLTASGIAAVGAGRGPHAARQETIVDAAGVRVGLLAVTDHPIEYEAREQALGVAHDRLETETPEWIRGGLHRLARDADVVIAFPHWGPNMATEPAHWQRERADEMLSDGAALVAGHSAHVFHGVERHGAGWAIYDLGDALDDYAVDGVRRNDLGLLALWRPCPDPVLELVGLRLHFAYTELASGDDADWIASRLTTACAELGSEVSRLTENRFALR